jgi:hypothetical protein
MDGLASCQQFLGRLSTLETMLVYSVSIARARAFLANRVFLSV